MGIDSTTISTADPVYDSQASEFAETAAKTFHQELAQHQIPPRQAKAEARRSPNGRHTPHAQSSHTQEESSDPADEHQIAGEPASHNAQARMVQARPDPTPQRRRAPASPPSLANHSRAKQTGPTAAQPKPQANSSAAPAPDQTVQNTKWSLLTVYESESDQAKGKALRALDRDLRTEFNTELRRLFPIVTEGGHTIDQRRQAGDAIKKNHAGDGIDPLIDAVVAKPLAVKSWAKAVKDDPSHPLLTEAEQKLAAKDRVNFAFVKASGVVLDGESFDGQPLSDAEKTIRDQDPFVFTLLQSSHVRVEQDKKMFWPVVTVDGKPVPVGSVGTQAWSDQKLVDFAYSLLRREEGAGGAVPAGQPQAQAGAATVAPNSGPVVPLSQETIQLWAATSPERLDHAKSEVRALVDAGKWQEAQITLRTQMNAAALFSKEARAAIWEQAGLPVFNAAYIDGEIDRRLKNPIPYQYPRNLNTVREADYADKPCQWARDFPQEAPSELAALYLDRMQEKLSLEWFQYNSEIDVNAANKCFIGLSTAVERAPSRAKATAQWLTSMHSLKDPSKRNPGASMFNALRFESLNQGAPLGFEGMGFHWISRDLATGVGPTLSRAIADELKASTTSYTLQDRGDTVRLQVKIGTQQFVSDISSKLLKQQYAEFQAKPQENADAYFEHFVGDPNIGRDVNIDAAEASAGKTQRINIAARAMGFAPTENQAQAARGDTSVPWYTPGTRQYMTGEVIAHWLEETGAFSVNAKPVIYAAERDGAQHGALFSYKTPDGTQGLIDGRAAIGMVAIAMADPQNPKPLDFGAAKMKRYYENLQHFREVNDYSDEGQLYVPADLTAGSGSDVMAAAVTTKKEKVKHVGGVAVGVVATVASVVATVASDGAASPALIASLAFLGIGTSAALSIDQLRIMHECGQDIGWDNAKGEYINLGASLLSAGAAGTGLKASMAAVNGQRLLAEGAMEVRLGMMTQNWANMGENLGSVSQGLGKTAQGLRELRDAEVWAGRAGVLGNADSVVGFGLMAKNGGEMALSWGEMTKKEKEEGVAGFGAGIGSLAIGIGNHHLASHLQGRVRDGVSIASVPPGADGNKPIIVPGAGPAPETPHIPTAGETPPHAQPAPETAPSAAEASHAQPGESGAPSVSDKPAISPIETSALRSEMAGDALVSRASEEGNAPEGSAAAAETGGVSVAPSSDQPVETLRSELPPPPQVETMLPPELQALSVDEVKTIPRPQLDAMDGGKLANLKLGGLPSEIVPRISIENVPPSNLAEIPREHLGWVSTDQIARLSPEQLGALTPEQLGGLTLRQRDALTDGQRQHLTKEQQAGLDSAYLNTPFGPVHIERPKYIALEGDGAAGRTKSLLATPPESMTNISPRDIRQIPAADVPRLKPEQLHALNFDQLSVLTNDQIGAMAPSQVAALDPLQIGALSPGQRGALTQAQTAPLNDAQKGALTWQWLPARFGPVSMAEVVPSKYNNFSPLTLTGLPKARPSSPINEVGMMFPGRGVRNLETPQGIEAAAQVLLNQDHVMLITGFNVAEGMPETDGPPGTALLGRTLTALGKTVTYVTEPANAPILKATLEALGQPTDNIVVFRRPAGDGPWDPVVAAREVLKDKKPDAVMAIEVPGRSSSGEPRNMRGIPIGDFNEPLDAFLLAAQRSGKDDWFGIPWTLGVGDGGNEAGMGVVSGHVPPALNGTDMASQIPADILATASVSNWGAEAVAAATASLAGRPDLLHTPAQQTAAIDASVKAGAVDGVSRKPVSSVDGFSWEAHQGWHNLMAQAADQTKPPIRVGVMDSSDGGIWASPTLLSVIEGQTGRPVQLIMALDHGNAPYGVRNSADVGAITNKTLRTLDDALMSSASPTVIAMACNTACTGINYRAGITTPVVDLVTVTAGKMVELGGDHIVSLSTSATAGVGGLGGINPGEPGAYGKAVKPLLGEGRKITELGASNKFNSDLDLASLVNGLSTDHPPSPSALAKAVQHYVDQIPTDATTVWLTCTHYPALQTYIEAAIAHRTGWKGTPPKVVNPMQYQAQEVVKALGLGPNDRANPANIHSPPPVIVTSAGNSNSPFFVNQIQGNAVRILGREDVRMVGITQFPADPLEVQHRMYAPSDPNEGTLHVWSKLNADGTHTPIEAEIRKAETDGYKELQARQIDMARQFENVLRAIAGYGPVESPGEPGAPPHTAPAPEKPAISPIETTAIKPEMGGDALVSRASGEGDSPEGSGAAAETATVSTGDEPVETLRSELSPMPPVETMVPPRIEPVAETSQTPPAEPGAPASGRGWRYHLWVSAAEYGPLLATSATLAATVPPQYLALANGAAWVGRGLGMIPQAVWPQAFQANTPAGRALRAWNGLTFIANGAYHGWTVPHGAGMPHNALYAVSDHGSLIQNAHEARTGETLPKGFRLANLGVANTANALLLPLYSIPAGVQAWGPNLLFGGGTAYLTCKALGIVEGGPQATRVATAAVAAGLAAFGTDYLLEVALPQLDGDKDKKGGNKPASR